MKINSLKTIGLYTAGFLYSSGPAQILALPAIGTSLAAAAIFGVKALLHSPTSCFYSKTRNKAAANNAYIALTASAFFAAATIPVIGSLVGCKVSKIILTKNPVSF